MILDRDRLTAIFESLGRNLTKPATVCLIGSGPAILLGQPDRQSGPYRHLASALDL